MEVYLERLWANSSVVDGQERVLRVILHYVMIREANYNVVKNPVNNG